jgi:uncharacterized protein YkwD
MKSPGPRKNFLNPVFREIGLCLSTVPYTTVPGTTTMYVVDLGARR